MGVIEHRRFVPTTEDRERGAVAMNKEEILEQLTRYKQQNPAKYAIKKEALFARYGLTEVDLAPAEPDADDLELAAMKAKTKKTT